MLYFSSRRPAAYGDISRWATVRGRTANVSVASTIESLPSINMGPNNASLGDGAPTIGHETRVTGGVLYARFPTISSSYVPAIFHYYL